MFAIDNKGKGYIAIDKINKIVEEQQQEIERLQHNQEVSTKWEIKLTQKNTKLIEENKRLNNIINGLEKWLNDEIEQLKFEDDYDSADVLKIVLEELEELKELNGSDKE